MDENDPKASLPALSPTDLPAELWEEIAGNVRPLEEAAPAYGFDPQAVRELLTLPAVKLALAKREYALGKDGYSIKYVARLGAMEGVKRMIQIIQDPESAPGVVINATEKLADIGEVKTKQAALGNVNAGFSFNIHLSRSEDEIRASRGRIAPPKTELPIIEVPVAG